MEDYYTFDVICENCGKPLIKQGAEVQVPKGLSIKEFKLKTPCPDCANCGCPIWNQSQ